jgi:putative transposase
MTAKKFRNKYRIPSIRAPWWDYGKNAAYFVTICTQRRECFFGEIAVKKMHLSDIGEIAQSCWQEIPQHFPYAKLGTFIIMPNHVHGIIIVDKMYVPVDMDTLPIELESIRGKGGFSGNNNPMLNDNLAKTIRWYKGRTSFESHKTEASFAWQSLYYDRIIRNEQTHRIISAYIIHNPAKWEKDIYHLE